MKRSGITHRDGDRGAALILTIGFVVMVGAISAGLAALVTSSLNNRGTLEVVRNRQYAADGAIEEAITRVRFQGGAPLTACSSPDGSIVDTLNGIAVRVDWHNSCGAVTASDGSIVAQRNVIFTSCPNIGSVCATANVIIRAQVNFEQAGSGAVTKTFVQSWSVNR